MGAKNELHLYKRQNKSKFPYSLVFISFLYYFIIRSGHFSLYVHKKNEEHQDLIGETVAAAAAAAAAVVVVEKMVVVRGLLLITSLWQFPQIKFVYLSTQGFAIN